MQQAKLNIWIEAARPQTLPAAFVPVLVGATLAYQHGKFSWSPTIVAFLCAFLIQIGTNFANDYFDFVKGADTDDRIGFKRATAKGLVTADQMKLATFLTMAFAFLLGLYLAWHAGWIILVIGLASIVFGILYTGGPFPLGYNGLGDLFVFIFFGIVAVTGTYYVNALEWSTASIWASIPVGALATNILVVNNLRDVEQDKSAGKNTIGVLLGEQALRWEYLIMLVLSYFTLLYFHLGLNYKLIILAPLITLPYALFLAYRIWTENNKSRLNKCLERAAQLMVFFGLLFSVGIILS